MIDLIKRGGLWYDIAGTTPPEVLNALVNSLTMPDSINRQALLQAILEREALMPTAVGHGIALPHPRSPVIKELEEQFVSIAFPRQPIDWKALDGMGVDSVILIVSASAKLHLKTLSQINFLCQHEDFRLLLHSQPSQESIIAAIQAFEETWRD
ncbi:MAG: PTS sugar transporter subunit IIA [Spirochaetaceae bacterium]|jgi:PTS system nitrogen regulatory IIA component|nr:PTS sugar transporter subunit IIA [Spirochaetaceae bacterium]